jgi:hypothetical protein
VAPGLIISVNVVADWLIRNFPKAEIIDGEIQFQGIKEPYKRTEQDRFFFLIDTKNASVNFDPDYEYGLLVKKDRMLIKSGQFTKEYAFPKDRKIVVNEKTILNWKNIILVLGVLFVFIINVLNSAFTKTVQSLIFSGIVFIIMKFRNTPVPYPVLWRISAYAITAPLFLSFFVILLGFYTPFFWMLYLAFYLIFFLGAVNSAVREG